MATGWGITYLISEIEKQMDEKEKEIENFLEKYRKMVQEKVQKELNFKGDVVVEISSYGSARKYIILEEEDAEKFAKAVKREFGDFITEFVKGELEKGYSEEDLKITIKVDAPVIVWIGNKISENYTNKIRRITEIFNENVTKKTMLARKELERMYEELKKLTEKYNDLKVVYTAIEENEKLRKRIKELEERIAELESKLEENDEDCDEDY